MHYPYKPYKFFLFIVIFTVNQLVQAQNLVQNYDFSANTNCPGGLSQLQGYASNWMNGTGSPDYYHTCGSGSFVPPNSYFGYQATYNGGVAYVSFIVSPSASSHESFWQNLSGTITAGQNVYYEYYVVRGEKGKYAPYKFGIQFRYNSTVVHTEVYNDTLTDVVDWEKVSGCFVAPADINQIEVGAVPGSSGVVMYDATATYSQSYCYIANIDVEVSTGTIGSTVDTVTICQGATATLTSNSSSGTYTWSTGATTQSIQTSVDGIYWVSSGNGCLQTVDSFVVQTVNQASFTVNLGPDTGVCKGGSILLDAGNTGSTYAWSNGSTNQTLLIKDTMFVSGGYFSVVVTQGGCTDEDTIMVIFQPEPAISMNDTVFCQNTTVTLDATYIGATDYLWSTGATTATLDVSTQGQYSVIINNNGCLGYDTVNTYMIPVMPINLGADTILCENNTLTLDVGNAGTSYSWSTGETTSSIVVSAAGEYSIIVQNSYCYSYDTILVSYQTYPVVGLGDDLHICIGYSTTLSTAYNGALYSWSTGETTQSIDVNTTDEYWLIVDMNHCRDTDTVFVRVDPLPEFELGEERSICPEEEIVIAPEVEADIFIWIPSQISGPEATITAAGTYVVTAIDSNGCEYTDSLTFNDYCPTVLYVPSSFTPNGDGKNDVFIPKGNNVYSFSMRIYNRWGNEIFFTNSFDKTWDGKISGNPVAEDVYLWKIVYEGERENNIGMQKEMTGNVVLYR